MQTAHGLEDDPESMFFAAVHLAMIGFDAQAMDLFERVVQHEPNNAQAHWRLASLLHAQMSYDPARHHFAEAFRLNPADSYSQQMLETISSRVRE